MAASAAAEIDPLATGWRRDPTRARLVEPTGRSGLVGGRDRAASLPRAARGVRPIAAASGDGDTLLISRDDGFPLVPFAYEGRLAVAPGAAGSGDRLAFRFETQALARELPVTVTAVDVGFDNAFGRTTWPLIGLFEEDPAAPLAPGPMLDAAVNFADPQTMLAMPAVAGVADEFRRFRVALPAPVAVAGTLDVDDGMWSDDFTRATEELLDNPASDWLECDFTSCQLPDPSKRLLVRANQVLKQAAGGALGVKFPAVAVAEVRPVTDLDRAFQVGYDVSSATAEDAGLFFRLQSLSQFYRVTYRKLTSEVELIAETPTGPVVLASSGPLAPTTNGVLYASTRETRAATHIEVRHDGNPVISFDDATYRYAGVLAGVVSLGPSSDERWDDFRSWRDRDVFAVVELPPGEDVALPAEYSSTFRSGPFRNVLASDDGGLSYRPFAPGLGCVEPPNGFVRLEVTDDADGVDDLFLVETKLMTVELDCPTCTETTRNRCSDDLGPLDFAQPVFEVGSAIEINTSFWNEHTADVDRLLLRVEVWREDCTGPARMFETGVDVLPVLSPGQNAAGAVLQTLAAPALSYTPLFQGSYCVQVTEYYDRNGDDCPDGFETAPGLPCPAGCTCVADPDDNPSTALLRRRFLVELPGCAPRTMSELDPRSLRVVDQPGDTTLTELRWRRAVFDSQDPARSFNVQLTERKPWIPLLNQAPPFWQVVSTMQDASYTDTVPLTQLGDVMYLVVRQNDGCPSGWSLADP